MVSIKCSHWPWSYNISHDNAVTMNLRPLYTGIMLNEIKELTSETLYFDIIETDLIDKWWLKHDEYTR